MRVSVADVPCSKHALAKPLRRPSKKWGFGIDDVVPDQTIAADEGLVWSSESAATAGRRKLSARDVRALVKQIDRIYEVAVGVPVTFQGALEEACSKLLIHPEDARKAIGLEFLDGKIPARRAVNE